MQPNIRIGLFKFIITHSILLIAGQLIIIIAGIYFTQSILQEIWSKKFENQSEILVNALNDEISDRAMLLRQWGIQNLQQHTKLGSIATSGELLRLFNSDLELYTFGLGSRKGVTKKISKIVQIGLTRLNSVYVEPLPGEAKKFGFALCTQHQQTHTHCVYAESSLQLQTYAIRDHILRNFRIDLIDNQGETAVEFFPYNVPFGNTAARYQPDILKTIVSDHPTKIKVNGHTVFGIKRTVEDTDYKVIILAPVSIYKNETADKKRTYDLVLISISIIIFLINMEFFRRKILIPTLELKKYEKLISEKLNISPTNSGGLDEINLIKNFFETLYLNIQVFKKKQENFQDELKKEIDFLEKDRAKITSKLIQSEKVSVINRLMSGVAHEIKNPLASIKLSIDNLRLIEKNLSAESNKKLNVISEEVIRLSSVLNRFLSIGKQKDSDLRFKQSNLNDIIQHILKLLQPTFEEKKVHIETKLDITITNQDFVVEEISSALINLFKNSLEAINYEGIIRVTTQKDESCVYLFVEDSGVGIPEENFQKIFDVFFTTKPNGTGLGMSQILQAVTIHNGDIEILKSILGGACIKISLPIKGVNL